MSEERREDTAPPQLMFDDGSRIMATGLEEGTAEAEHDSTESSPSQTLARRKDMPVEVYYEIDRLAKEILEIVHLKETDKEEDGWLCRVALQFPDELLADATQVCWAMEEALQQKHELEAKDNASMMLPPLVFVLGDSTFGPCCPDEVTALHLDADVLIHYGHACLSPALSLPILYSFGITDMSVETCVNTVVHECKKEGVQRLLLLYEVRYHHAMEALQTQLSEKGEILVLAGQLPQSCEKCANAEEQEDNQTKSFVVGGLELPVDTDFSSYTLLFVGDPAVQDGATASSRQYVNCMLRFLSSPSGPANHWTYSPALETLETSLPPYLRRQLNRRFYLTQKARDASTFGILVGTLSQRHFRTVVSSLRRVIEDAGRASYTFAVGKINAAKLANFGVIECYVLVACGENTLLDGERDFHVPVISPLELEMALGNVEWGSMAYSLDYNDFLSIQGEVRPQEQEGEDDDAPYFSLVKGRYMDSKKKQSVDTDLDLSALPGKGQVTAYKSEASEFLKNREYKGLETRVAQTEAHAAVPGSSGIASNYGEKNRDT